MSGLHVYGVVLARRGNYPIGSRRSAGELSGSASAGHVMGMWLVYTVASPLGL